MTDREKLMKLIGFLSSYIKVEPEESAYLEDIIELRQFHKKEIIHQQGSLQKYLGFIIKGGVRFYHTDGSGKEDTIEFVFENLPIGQYRTLVSQEKTPASAQAMEDTELLIISKDKFLGFMSQFPRYYTVLADVMGSALLGAINRNKLSRIMSSKERYDEFCKMHEQTYHRIPLKYVASYLNMAQGTLSRVRAGTL